ncbi:ABC transporter ATP-binding protein [Agromyces indicus]|uniref:ABC transporter ATP-binding protein n=1 Tax=Agromyces indicus TaxID=758919 RepID=A0ABU1FND2_9MICO|nr:ABC transporter ATP-binding protein [Agromyces indicus]MDR5693265.1 ABC transporter ATP-binding protein [Agromyces indicus]
MTHPDSHALRAEGLRLGYDGRTVVDGLDLAVPDARITAIVGPNGSGKSTLLRGLARLIVPQSGRVSLDGRDVRSYGAREFARRVAVLPQQPVAPDGVLVSELVARGRHPHRGWFGGRSSDDDRIVAEALAATGTAELAARPVAELSGGQRQRVWIAMVLAQRAGIVLLDEPTSFLDAAHQLELLDLLTESNREHGTTVVMVLHELNLAARYADHLVVVDGGRIRAAGHPAEVMTADTVAEAFGLECLVTQDPVAGSPLVVPIGRYHRGASDLG